MPLKVVSPAVRRGLVLLTMAVLTPAMTSAQDVLDTATNFRQKAEATLPEAIFRLKAEATIPDQQPEATPVSIQPLPVSQIRAAVSLYPLPSVERDARKRFQDPAGVQLTGKPRKSVIGWSIAIGIGAGLVASAIAASKYGENEGGEFCGRCFMEWSAITLPVGAGAGALVGYLIDQSRK